MKSTPTLYGVIGDPINHSLSPRMQTAALRAKKISATYLPFLVTPNNLKKFVTESKKTLAGFNVTIPHKEIILPFMDKLTTEAKLAGAVNTVKIQKNKLIGHNTDLLGYILSLKKEARFSVKGKKVIILGAGGAARAIAVGLALAGVSEIIILNRTLDKAEAIANNLKRKFKKIKWQAAELGNKNDEIWNKTALVINTTSLGLKTKTAPPIYWQALPPNSLISDIVYGKRTPLLKTAKKRGHPIHEGFGMLLYQGALAFEFWTNKKAPIAIMKKALLYTAT